MQIFRLDYLKLLPWSIEFNENNIVLLDRIIESLIRPVENITSGVDGYHVKRKSKDNDRRQGHSLTSRINEKRRIADAFCNAATRIERILKEIIR